MFKKTITYADFNGVERTEDFYFNLTEAEIADMQITTVGGLDEFVRRIVAAKNQVAIVGIFKRIIKASYGVKSDDGRRFIKNDQIWEEFAQTNAYSQFYMELATNADAAAAFINGITPATVTANAPGGGKVLSMNPV